MRLKTNRYVKINKLAFRYFILIQPPFIQIKSFRMKLFSLLSALAGLSSAGDLIARIGKPAPAFTAEAVVDGEFKQVILKLQMREHLRNNETISNCLLVINYFSAFFYFRSYKFQLLVVFLFRKVEKSSHI